MKNSTLIFMFFYLVALSTQAQLEVQIADSVLYKYDYFSVERTNNVKFPFNKKEYNAEKTICTFKNGDNKAYFTFYEFSLSDTLDIVKAINKQYPKKIASPEEFGIHYFVRHNFYGNIETIRYNKDLLFLQFRDKVIFLEVDDNHKRIDGIAPSTYLFGLEFSFLFNNEFELNFYELLNRANYGSFRGM